MAEEERSGSNKPDTEDEGGGGGSDLSDHQYTELLVRETSGEHNVHSHSPAGGGGSGVTPVLIVSVFAAVFGSSAQFGFNLVVLNNLEKPIRASFDDGHGHLPVSSRFSDLEWAAAAAIFAVGGMLGSLLTGFIADIVGRKWAMLINNAVAVLGVCIQALAVHPYMLIVGRLVIGINAGANTVLAPLYISEVSPVRHRGSVGVCHQLAITLVILISQILGIQKVLGTPDDDFYGWRILLAVPLVFVVVQVSLLPFCPESPKYLYIRKGKMVEAEEALSRLTGSQGYREELRAIQEEYEQTTSRTQSSVKLIDFVLKPSLRRAILISIALHMSQQLTGIGSILLYSTDIFRDAGVANGDIATIVTGLVLLVGTIFTIFLIERAGRRTLMLYGLGGMAVFFSLVSAAFCFQYALYGNSYKPNLPSILLVISTLGIIFTFALGPGAIPWLMVSELFQQAARPIAVSISTIINWLGNFTVSFVFPFMLQNLEPYPFIVFIAVSGFFWLIMFLYLPETKGKTVDEITHYFRRITKENRSSKSDHTHPPIIN